MMTRRNPTKYTHIYRPSRRNTHTRCARNRTCRLSAASTAAGCSTHPGTYTAPQVLPHRHCCCMRRQAPQLIRRSATVGCCYQQLSMRASQRLLLPANEQAGRQTQCQLLLPGDV
jgi:hypothetical protein